MLKKMLFLVVIVALFTQLSYAQETLTVFADPEGKPLSWQEGDQLVGPVVDLMTLIFRDFDIPVNTVVRPWIRALSELEKGEIDAILTIFYTAERANVMEFTIPYAQVETSIFVKQGNEFPFRTWDDLRNRRGLIGRGDSFGEEFDTFSKEHLTISEVSSSAQVLRMLAAEKTDYIIGVKNATLLELIKLDLHEKIVPLDVPIDSQDVHIGFSKQSSFLQYLPEVNKRIQELRDNGTFEKMVQKALFTSAEH